MKRKLLAVMMAGWMDASLSGGDGAGFCAQEEKTAEGEGMGTMTHT